MVPYDFSTPINFNEARIRCFFLMKQTLGRHFAWLCRGSIGSSLRHILIYLHKKEGLALEKKPDMEKNGNKN